MIIMHDMRSHEEQSTAKKQPYLKPYQFNSRPIIGDWGVAHPVLRPMHIKEGTHKFRTNPEMRNIVGQTV
jgi:hypothetical protein